MNEPSILSRLTLLAERIAPALARMPKSQRSTLANGTWRSLEESVSAIFAVLNSPTDIALRKAASTRFDLLKWYLRLLVQQRSVSPGWYASMLPDLVEIGKMMGGMQKK